MVNDKNIVHPKMGTDFLSRAMSRAGITFTVNQPVTKLGRLFIKMIILNII